MQINRVIVPESIFQKIKTKHNVNHWEAEEIFFNPDSDVFIRKSRRIEGRYLAYGRTYAGRYLVAAFILQEGRIAKVISARDMTQTERRQYGQHKRRR